MAFSPQLRLLARRVTPLTLATGAALASGTGLALAQDGASAPSEVIFLAELLMLMLVGRVMGEAMLRIGQPSVMGQLIAGILLGPSVFGLLWPDLQQALFPKAPAQKAMIDAISQFGVLLLLLLTGMETDLRLVRKVGRAAVSISLTGVAVPFACGVTLGELMPESFLPDPDKRLVTALFLGTALSISSIKVVAAIVREMGFTRRNLGQVIVASSIMEDTIGWIIVAITFGIAESGTVELTHVATSVLGTALFLAASFTIGRRIVFWLIRFTNDTFQSDFAVVTVILLIMGAMALITDAIGVHTVLGAFVAGVLVGKSPILSKHIDEQLRGLILAFFMPVFFGMAGLGTDLTILKDPALLLMTLGLIAVASLGKFAGAFLGGEIGGLSRREALALACGMNARGSTEVIVATIGLSMGALSQNLFTMIVAMAVVTTMAMPPMLRWGLSRVPFDEAERARLEREEFEAKGFVPNLERLLLTADDSANGQFAGYLAGLLAGPKSLPITVLPLASDEGETPSRVPRKPEEGRPAEAQAVADVVKATAAQSKVPDPDSSPSPPAEVTVRPANRPSPDALAEEVRKGYDLLIVGIKNAQTVSGGFNAEVTRIAKTFDGPLALALAGVERRELPNKSPLKILVPVTGTEVSRRAAKVAIAIGLVCRSSLTAVYVSTRRGKGIQRGVLARQNVQAILKDVVELADQYDYEVRTTVTRRIVPEEAILSLAHKGGHDLIVMGVSRRAGDRLDFGDTAAAIATEARCSVLFIVT